MNPTALHSNTPATEAAKTTPPAAQPPLMDRVVQGAHHTIDQIAERAAPHVQRLQENVSSANTRLHEGADRARELGNAWADTLRSTVREHPVAAVTTALVAGMLITRLLQPPR